MRRYITQESHKLEVQVRPPMAVTNAVSWRSEGIRYRKNEVFLDVIESVNLLVSTMPQPNRFFHSRAALLEAYRVKMNVYGRRFLHFYALAAYTQHHGSVLLQISLFFCSVQF